MTPPQTACHRRPTALAALSLALLATPVAAWSQAAATEQAALSELRATTLVLIDALVEQGLLTRAKADELVRRARASGEQAAAAPVPGYGWGAPKPVVRVPYLSESTRAQLKEDIRNDVLATARDEGWADARKLPSWLRAVTLEGDVRVRTQSEFWDEDNLGAEIFRAQTDSPAWAPDLLNTQHDRNRITVLPRLGLTAKASDSLNGGIRLVTGSTSGSPTSTSATAGNGANRVSIGLDRAYLRWEPEHGARVEGGRMAVPFDGTDLLWPDDLSLDGLAGPLTLMQLNRASGVEEPRLRPEP